MGFFVKIRSVRGFCRFLSAKIRFYTKNIDFLGDISLFSGQISILTVKIFKFSWKSQFSCETYHSADMKHQYFNFCVHLYVFQVEFTILCDKFQFQRRKYNQLIAIICHSTLQVSKKSQYYLAQSCVLGQIAEWTPIKLEVLRSTSAATVFLFCSYWNLLWLRLVANDDYCIQYLTALNGST